MKSVDIQAHIFSSLEESLSLSTSVPQLSGKYNCTKLDTVASLRNLLPFLPLSAPSLASRLQRLGTYHSAPRNATYNAASSQYASTIWAGASLEQSPVTSITGTFTVPTISAPAGATDSATTSYCGGAWVGIDGVTNICVDGGLMQAGVNWCTLNGVTTYTPWSEYWPEEAQVNFDNFPVVAGDQIRVTIRGCYG